MTSTRILPAETPLDTATADRMARLIPAGMPPPQLFLTLARNEGLFAFLVDSRTIGPTGLLDRKTLPRKLREAIILRTCVATANDYEFNLHVQTISARLGLTQAQIDDVRRESMDPQLWDPDQVQAARLVDSLVGRLDVPDDLFSSARAIFTEAQLIEITHLVGQYVGVAMLVALMRPQFDRYASETPVLARL